MKAVAEPRRVAEDATLMPQRPSDARKGEAPAEPRTTERHGSAGYGSAGASPSRASNGPLRHQRCVFGDSRWFGHGFHPIMISEERPQFIGQSGVLRQQSITVKRLTG